MKCLSVTSYMWLTLVVLIMHTWSTHTDRIFISAWQVIIILAVHTVIHMTNQYGITFSYYIRLQHAINNYCQNYIIGPSCYNKSKQITLKRINKLVTVACETKIVYNTQLLAEWQYTYKQLSICIEYIMDSCT